MRNTYQRSITLTLTILLLSVATFACTSKSKPTQSTNDTEPELANTESLDVNNNHLVTDTPNPKLDCPAYTLETEFPNSLKQLSLYKQTVPAGLPNAERLSAIMSQLKITGNISVSNQESESGDIVMNITSDTGSVTLSSDDPFIMGIRPLQKPDNGTPAKALSPDERIQIAETFLKERGLLDFPYSMEPPHLSRDRDRAIRVVPLIDGIPLYDYDALNGRLLVWFSPIGEISIVFWRPIKVVKGNLVDIVPASVAWEQLNNNPCWQAIVFDPKEPYAVAESVNYPGYNPSTTHPLYAAATINEIKLVYYAQDLYLGMSPFAFPADSPARDVIPMWQFSGITSDERDLVILLPAIREP